MAERLTLAGARHALRGLRRQGRARARRRPGVESASVNLATERATVAFDPTRTAVPALQAAVAAAGYELRRRRSPSRAKPRTASGPSGRGSWGR